MVGAALLQLERNGALVRAHAEVLSKRLDTADIVRDAILEQPVVAAGRSEMKQFGEPSNGRCFVCAIQ